MSMRWIFPVFALLIASSASAFPVTYNFSGYITEYAGDTPGYNPIPGTTFSGQLTYDASPTPATLMEWRITVAGENYYQAISSPLVQFIDVVGGSRISFFDEMPGNTAGAQWFDQGGINFLFTTDFGTTVPGSLPLPDFITGYFFLNGPAWQEMRGEITSLTLAVPEPASLLLLSLGLMGIALSHGRYRARCTPSPV